MGTTITPAASPVASPEVTPVTNRYQDPQAVTELQQQLADAGWLAQDQVDGKFGPVTRRAVERFQRSHPGLAVDGMPWRADGAPSQTQQKLLETQQALATLGDADLRALQSQYGLTADGIIGGQTLALLNRIAAASEARTGGIDSFEAAPSGAPAGQSAAATALGDAYGKLNRLQALDAQLASPTGTLDAKAAASTARADVAAALAQTDPATQDTLRANLEKTVADAQAAHDAAPSAQTFEQLMNAQAQLAAFERAVGGTVEAGQPALLSARNRSDPALSTATLDQNLQSNDPAVLQQQSETLMNAIAANFDAAQATTDSGEAQLLELQQEFYGEYLMATDAAASQLSAPPAVPAPDVTQQAPQPVEAADAKEVTPEAIDAQAVAPTASPVSSFDAAQTAKDLYEAMNGWGTDEARVFELLENRSYAETEAIKREFAAVDPEGRSLESWVRDEFQFRWGRDRALALLDKQAPQPAHAI